MFVTTVYYYEQMWICIHEDLLSYYWYIQNELFSDFETNKNYIENHICWSFAIFKHMNA